MGKPIAVRTLKVMDYLRKNPDVAAAKVAGKFGMSLSQVYGIRKRVRAEEYPPKKLVVPLAAAQVAQRLGISVEDYVKKIRETNPTAFEEPRDNTPDEEESPSEGAKEVDVDAVLDSRAKDYGKFIEGAEIMQMLKRLVHNYIEARGTQLAFDQREAIDMIIHKLGRIINGNPDKVDHWTDIAGYSKLVADRLEGNVR